MVFQSDLPDTWNCESPRKRVKVEIRVDDEDGQNWIEIPTSNVELYVNKDGLADVTRTAKVEFPTVWSGTSVVDLIKSFDAGGQFTFCRISFRHETSGRYVISHFGFISALGNTTQTGESKMWVFDMSEFIKGIPVSQAFQNPTIGFVLNTVSQIANENTPSQLVDPVVLAPNSEGAFERQASDFVEEAIDQSLIDEGAGLFNTLTDPAGINPFTERGYGSLARDALQDAFTDFVIDSVEVVGDNGRVDVAASFSATPVETFGDESNVNFSVFGFDFDVALSVTKRFQPNRDSLIDIMNWLAEKVGGLWYFEPTRNGVSLVLDVSPTRRPFIQNSVIQRELDADDTVYDHIRVIENTALFEINPVNTVIVRGELGKSVLGQRVPDYPVVGDILQPSKKFPLVKVRATPLYERALVGSGSQQKAELSAAIFETDDFTLEEAEKTAVAKMRAILEEETEGSITIFGNPKLRPYDRVDAYPTCAGQVSEADIQPFQYEVEGVKHVKTAGDEYKTIVYVSILVDESEIEIVSSTMEDTEQ